MQGSAAATAWPLLLLLLLSSSPWVAGQAPVGLGAVYRPSSPLNVAVWTNMTSGAPFPELGTGPFSVPSLKSKLSLGVALSNGGVRSASLALGTLRAMNMVRAQRGRGRGHLGVGHVEGLEHVESGGWPAGTHLRVATPSPESTPHSSVTRAHH